jgi:hypothetical protein
MSSRKLETIEGEDMEGKEELEEFKKRWLKKSEEIKKNAFDTSWAKEIKFDFIRELRFMLGHGWTFELTELSHDVDLALYIAISNYEKMHLEHRKSCKFWTKWGGFSLPEAKIKTK